MYLKIREKIIDAFLISLSAFFGYLIAVIFYSSIGLIDFYNVYAPTLPIQAEPFWEDITG